MLYLKKYIKVTVLIVPLLFIRVQLYSQCGFSSLIFNFPNTANGILINESSTESTQYWSVTNDTVTYCGMLCGTFEIGYSGVFTQILTFSSPVNNVEYIVTGSEAVSGGSLESFSFTVNEGILSCAQQNNNSPLCLYTQQGNLFTANSSPPDNGHSNGAYITLNSTIPYDTIKVYGTGTNGGSIMSLCANSINATGIQSLNKNGFVQAYPNPANAKINITCSLQVAICSLYDMLGNVIISTKEKEIDVSNLSNGVYFLNVKTNNSILTTKIIVQH